MTPPPYRIEQGGEPADAAAADDGPGKKISHALMTRRDRGKNRADEQHVERKQQRSQQCSSGTDPISIGAAHVQPKDELSERRSEESLADHEQERRGT